MSGADLGSGAALLPLALSPPCCPLLFLEPCLLASLFAGIPLGIVGRAVWSAPAALPKVKCPHEVFRLWRLMQTLLWSCCFGAFIVLQGGCSGPSSTENRVAPQAVGHVLSPAEAAQLAAKLANDECERLYRKRPFTADQHRTVLTGGRYRWGGLNEGGRGGLSALVVLGSDGGDPKVEVYFSLDANVPFGTAPPDKERLGPEPRQ
jgi:hypothetical protein